jgi:FkbM family methyltransferase
MYVPAPEKPLLRRIFRRAAWTAGETTASLISKTTGFHVPDEPLQPYALSLPMLMGTYERATANVMREIVRPGMTVIDGGAHVGYFTRLLSRLVGPTGKVLAFEIHPKTLELLRHNVRDLPNVEILPAALGATDGTAFIHESPGLSSRHSATASKPGLVPTSEVPMRSLVSVLRERGLQRVDFLKIDIEGGEPAVIRSLPKEPVKLIFEAKRYILEAAGLSPEGLFAEMIQDGFSLERIGGDPILPEQLAGESPEFDKSNVLAVRPS